MFTLQTSFEPLLLGGWGGGGWGKIRYLWWLLIARRKTLKTFIPITSGSLSQIRDPDFFPSRIPELGSVIHQKQKRVGIKICCLPFFVAIIHKIVIILVWTGTDKMCGQLTRNYSIVFLTQKIVTKLSEIWVGIQDPRSGIPKKLVLDPPVPRIRNTAA